MKNILFFFSVVMLIGMTTGSSPKTVPGLKAIPPRPTVIPARPKAIPPRPKGPGDIYAEGGIACVAAHSSTRALYASYNGPLYQVLRQSDGKTLDIGVVKPGEGDPGGYADAAAQDKFCANTTCWITVLYDQSGKGNHLVQAPRGGFSGPSMGGFNNLPIADMAPVTIMGHTVYGVFIAPGMGLRQNDVKGTAVDDQAEGQYWVINGHHFNNGCCYDYGNAETDSRDDGDGTMETTFFGNTTPWYHGQDNGPWVMTDQENNLVGCVNPSPNDKFCPMLPSVPWRFVTATADGEPHHWRSMGGDAQHGALEMMFDGTRIVNDRNSYDPMRKQGAILLGNGGDNSNGSQGTFYEGAMTAAGTFPTKEINQKVQANIVEARYDVPRVSLTPASAVNTPPGLQTFAPGSSQNSTVTFTNTTGGPVRDVTLSVVVPQGWSSEVLGAKGSKKFLGEIAPGGIVSATFRVTSGPEAFNGDLTGKASWKVGEQVVSETTVEKVRNMNPIKINEFRISDGSAGNQTNSFIELYNAGDKEVDISNWTFTHHPTQMPVFSSVKIPAGTKVSGHGFYLLGLSNSGLAVPAKKGESIIYVRNVTGMSVGNMVKIGSGLGAETRKIMSVTAPSPSEAGGGGAGTGATFGRPLIPGSATTVWQPLPEGPVITIPVGATNIPAASVTGFKEGDKMAIGYGAKYPTVGLGIEKYEVVTITKVGKPGTQAYLSADAKAGSTNIKVSSVANISVGDKIRLDIDSKEHGIETVTVTRVGTQSSRGPGRGPFSANEDLGTGLDLAEPIKFNHSANMPFSVRGTGISFEPATSFAHSSNEPVLPLVFSIKLDRPLGGDQDIDATVRDEKVLNSGYQGVMAPDQWFGGPALAAGAGNMSLRDAKGNVADALNYGGLVDPWLAEGYQAVSGTGANGSYVSSPGRGFGPGSSADRSAGRFPDGFDSDDNGHDFMLQNTISLVLGTEVGATNVKVNSVANFSIGQRCVIGSGVGAETAIIATIGTAGGTKTEGAVSEGATVIPVGSVMGFEVGQKVTIGTGDGRETAVVASVVVRRRGPRNNVADSIMVSAPLKFAHGVGAEVFGSGIGFAAPLMKGHENGAVIASDVPTPGEPNRFGVQAALGQKANDVNTPLHAMQPNYPIPYGVPLPEKIKATLDRMLGYLNAVTPAQLVNRQSNEAVQIGSGVDTNVIFRQGDFRLTSYEWGVTYAGMTSVGQVTGDRRYTNYTRERMEFLGAAYPAFKKLYEQYPTSPNALRQPVAPHALDDAGAICAAMIKEYHRSGNPVLRPLINHYIEYISTKEYRLTDGTLARNRPQKNTLWLDDLFMSVPALAQMGKLTGESKYYTDAIKQVLQFTRRMFNKELGIYMHGWVEGMAEHPEFHWARANGWAVMAMTELLDVLPEDFKERSLVMEQLKAHIHGLVKYQSGQGFWHQLLDRNDSYLETSATAIYTYCIAKAVNKGWIDPKVYAPVCLLGWNAVSTAINEQGQVEGTCVGTGMAFDPAFYYYRPVNVYAAHGYGPVLLAGAEIIQMLKKYSIGINDSAVMVEDK